MVNFSNPVVVEDDFRTLQVLCHTLDGLYIWEFVTTLDYELRVIRGRLPYRWTVWLYSLTRLATLMAVIFNLITLNMTASGQTSCQLLYTFCFVFVYVTFALSSLLIILRVIAIWNKNKIAVGLAAIVWAVNVAFLIEGLIMVRSEWFSEDRSCSAPDVTRNQRTIVFMFITDFVLLVTMLVGLLRLRYHGAGTFGLGRLLWKQGVLWLLLATAAELPPAVFICLKLNGAFNLMFLLPSLITMSLAATRMYRSLADFGSATDVMLDLDNAPRIGRLIPNATSSWTMPTPPRRVEAAVYTANETYPTSGTGESVIYIGRYHQEQLERDKPESLCSHEKAKGGA